MKRTREKWKTPTSNAVDFFEFGRVKSRLKAPLNLYFYRNLNLDSRILWPKECKRRELLSDFTFDFFRESSKIDINMKIRVRHRKTNLRFNLLWIIYLFDTRHLPRLGAGTAAAPIVNRPVNETGFSDGTPFCGWKWNAINLWICVWMMKQYPCETGTHHRTGSGLAIKLKCTNIGRHIPFSGKNN